MDAAAELVRNPVCKHQIQPEYGDEQADAGRDVNPSRETKFSGTHGDRGILVFPVQLTTSRIGNITRFIHTLLNVMTIHTDDFASDAWFARDDEDKANTLMVNRNDIICL